MSAQTTTKILLFGATGYVGGGVLARLIEHPNAQAFHITILVRDPKKAEILKKFGVHAVVVGSLKDTALVEKLASEANVVFGIADSDDLPAVNATLAGLKKRHATMGSKPIYIHTSGAGVLADDARGMHSNAVVYDDSDADQIETLAPTQMHRNLDMAITQADAEGYVKTYIIIPMLIWGVPKGPLVDLGIQHMHSLGIPFVVNAALQHGQAGMVGAGKNIWAIVEVNETSDLYIKLYDAIVADATTGHGRNGFYFAAHDEQEFYGLVAAVGKALVGLGKSASPEPTTFTQANLDTYFKGSAVLGANVRVRPTHALSLGWKPVRSASELLESVQPEVAALLKEKAV
ncbi:hypothetical protein B0H15DRAFT_913557 [Mycena belliarum]|uniref:NmrA-like domain-containing protein n=1 Tax=Mycena belliarum TaxID=1033014 RepID=A0AAD6TUV0_9AGAR|nr:hypothetical protein B0H15DRAFT_913557 [Mycena belliae]